MNIYRIQASDKDKSTMNELKNVPTHVLNEIIESIESIGGASSFHLFASTESIHLDTKQSDTWITINSQSDTGEDGSWGTRALLDIEYGDDEHDELETSKTVGNGTITKAEQDTYEELINKLTRIANSR